jgi:hypothetical protein
MMERERERGYFEGRGGENAVASSWTEIGGLSFGEGWIMTGIGGEEGLGLEGG